MTDARERVAIPELEAQIHSSKMKPIRNRLKLSVADSALIPRSSEIARTPPAYVLEMKVAENLT